MNINSEFRFDRWLRNELYMRDMTQKELAEKADITTATVSYLLHNQKMPTIRTLELILNALDMHMEFVHNGWQRYGLRHTARCYPYDRTITKERKNNESLYRI